MRGKTFLQKCDQEIIAGEEVESLIGEKRQVSIAPETSLRARLISLILKLSLFPDPELTEETSLIQGGVIDSTAILQLAEWIESETDVDLDLLQFDLAREWDTILRIEQFIQRHRRNAVS